MSRNIESADIADEQRHSGSVRARMMRRRTEDVAGKVEEVVQSLRISSVAVPTVWPTQQRHAYSIGGTVGVKCKLVQGVVIAKQLDGRLRPLEDILKELAK
ncbi:hypothetical protein FOZ63_010544 [Perkinsus olseni]|uniref:Uncharacterized protein n=1 Tax=Perkinsus olseni TaxID=32597 RepID=A0A7J6QZI1_PEROL|nr:hypothetical protein FOZ63_010544 [Perkinsus olseni]